jgi:autotransporter-associated beta strand protein
MGCCFNSWKQGERMLKSSKGYDSRRKNVIRLAAIAGTAGLLQAKMANAQQYVSYSTGTYSQNFDVLPEANAEVNSGSSISITTPGGSVTVAPTPTTGSWYLGNSTSSGGFVPPSADSGNSSGNLTGWYASASVANQVGAQQGGQTKGGIIDYGLNGNSNRALGLISTSTSGNNEFALEIVNTSGGNLTTATISYTGELWREQTTSNPLGFSYDVGATPGTTIPSSGLTANSSGNVSLATGTSGAVNGDAAGNETSINFNLNGINWVNGTAIWLVWSQASSSGAQGYAIDNFSLTASTGGSSPSTDTWTNGSGNSSWDNTSSNWTDTPSGTKYTDGDNVIFGNVSGSASQSITVNNVTAGGGVTPTSVLFNATTTSYALSGASILGTTGVTVDAPGETVTFSSANGYTGGTIVSAGTLVVASSGNGDSALGNATGTLTLAGGTLQTNTAITTTRALTVQAGSGGTGTFNTNSLSSSMSGTVNIADTLTINGGGSLTLSGVVTETGSGTISLASGTSLVLDPIAVTKVTDSLLGDVYAGSVTLGDSSHSNYIQYFAYNGSVTGNGSISVLNGGTGNLTTGAIVTGVEITNNKSVTSIGVPIILNPNGNATTFTGGNVSASPFTPANFTVSIGAGTAGDSLTLTQPISGYSDVNITNDLVAAGGAGNTTLNALNTYKGATTINSGAGVIQLNGGNNTLPTTTDLIAGTYHNPSSASATSLGTALDLHGFNQQLDSLSDGGNETLTNHLSIVDTSSTASTLTISGSTTPYNGFSGVIAGGSLGGVSLGAINLVKAGTSALTLLNTNTYTGGTAINGGTIFANSATEALGTGSVSVNSGGTLAGNGTTGAGVVTVGGGGTIGAGSNATSVGTLHTDLTLNGNSTLVSKVVSITANGSVGSYTLATAGTDNDTIVDGGSTIINAVAGSPLTVTLAAPTGTVSGFNPANSYAWQVLSSGNITVSDLGGNFSYSGNPTTVLARNSNNTGQTPQVTGTDSADFTLNTAAFASAVGATGDFSLDLVGPTTNGQSGTLDVVYNGYSAAPEPGTAMLVLAGGVPIFLARRRRQISKPANV